MFSSTKTITIFAIILLFSLYKAEETASMISTEESTLSATEESTSSSREESAQVSTALQATKKSNGSIVTTASCEIFNLAILAFLTKYFN